MVELAVLTKPEPKIEKVGIRVHVGNTISYLAQTYKDATNAVVELIQNSLDQGARNIHVVINQAKSSLHCYDNGSGASKEEIRFLWQNVGVSVKKGDKKKGGEKGIGRFSGLAIAKRLSITTRPGDNLKVRYFTAWINREELAENADPELSIRDEDANHSLSGGISFKPTTLVAFAKIDQSSMRELSRIEEIADRISEAWGEKIKKKKVDVQIIFKPETGGEKRIAIKPVEFDGTRCERVSIKTQRGTVDFDFYVSIKPISSPKIIVIHRDQQEFPLYKMPLLWREVRELLGSGHYQGYIRVDFCTIRADREGFQRDDDENVFCETIRKFVEEEVRPNFAELKSEHRLARYSEAIESAVLKMDRFFKDHPAMRLAGRLSGFVSEEHIEAKEANSTAKKFRLRAPTLKESKERVALQRAENEKNRHKEPPRHEQLKKVHSSVAHPAGRERRIIKSQFGLTADYEEGSTAHGFLWRTRVQNGVISFNISHKDWIACDTAGVRALEEYVTIHLVKEIATLAAPNDKIGESFRKVFDEQFTPFFSSIR